MESKLKALFDFHRFLGNKRLEKMITEAELYLGDELDDDDLSYVSAAGDNSDIPKKEDNTNDN